VPWTDLTSWGGGAAPEVARYRWARGEWSSPDHRAVGNDHPRGSLLRPPAL